METLTYGPLLEETRLTAGLDYYKPTMSQLYFNEMPAAEVTFTFKNRGGQRLADYVDAEDLRARLDFIRDRGWSDEELNYLRTLKNSKDEWVFGDDFLASIKANGLPEVGVRLDETTNDLAIETTGPAPEVTFWETVVMGEVNEAYFEGFIKAHGLDILDVYDEGDRRLSEKIAVLQANPDIKFADFGTRRHFSLRWQRHVLERLQAECSDNFIGTSNVGLAQEMGLRPIGTFAHELPMVYAGLCDAVGGNVRSSHREMQEDWYDFYGEDLSIALTDTFTTDFFFEDFTAEQAVKWRGLRQDSGDPVAFAEKAIAFYEQHGIDPKSKTIVFSDGLDIDEIVRLHGLFKHKVNVLFGWGTTLTNDLGLKPLNIVMKATEVKRQVQQPDGRLARFIAKLVKLSDDFGKHTGPDDKVAEYYRIFVNKENDHERHLTTV